jgi:WD40 repeat protein
VAFSPDGRLLAFGSVNTVRVWDAATGKQTATPAGPQNPSGHGLAFSPDGRYLALADEELRLKLWDAATGRQRVFASRQDPYWTSGDLAFTPDGRRLASANGNEVKVWDVDAGQEVCTLHGHTKFVTRLAFSPDGQRLVSGGLDETLRIWDVNTGYETLTLHGPAGEVKSVTFVPDGWRILSAHRDGAIKVWDATPLTEDTRVEREAANLVGFLSGKLLPRKQVLSAVRQDPTISEPLRQKALGLAEQPR